MRILPLPPYTTTLQSQHHPQLQTAPKLTCQLRHSKKSDAPTNPRGIPFAPFVDNVSDYCTTRAEVEPTLKSFSEMIQKYQFMEVNTSRRASGLREKIPDISKTLDTVRFLKSRADDAEELESFFELNDTLYAKAKVPKTEEVYLWLGANVMLAYPMEEAEELLEGKLEAAKSGLENAEEDMDFLREQITVSAIRYADWEIPWLTDDTDTRGRYCSRLQLGCRYAQKGQGRGQDLRLNSHPLRQKNANTLSHWDVTPSYRKQMERATTDRSRASA